MKMSRLWVPLSAVLAVAACKEEAKPTETKTTPEGATPAGAAAVELPPGDGPVASVNGVNIPRAPFNKEYKLTIERYQKARHDVQPALKERLKDNIVRRLVDAELIRQQAEKMSVAVDKTELETQWAEHKKRYGTEDAFKQFLERAGTTAEDVREQFEQNQLREKVFTKVSETVQVTPEEVKDYYEKNQARYDEPEQVQASHILIRVAPDAKPEDKAAKKKLAEEVHKKAKAKGADFAALAKEFGEDPTKDRGGDLGFFQRGRMVKPFEDAVWGLKVGDISGVVETQFGFHVIKKVDHKQARKKPFNEVQEQISRSLQAKKRNEAIRDALAKWKAEAKIELFVKGDEKIIAAGTPAPGTLGPSPALNVQNKLEEKGIQIQRLTPPTTNDQPVKPAEQH